MNYHVDEEQDTEETEDGSYMEDQEQIETDIINVRSSFLLLNYQDLVEADVDLSTDGVLHKAYVDFVHELMDTVCPMGIPCPEEDDGNVSDENADGEPHRGRRLLSRRLCHDMHRERRILCGPYISHRNLKMTDADNSPGGILQDASLEEVSHATCPTGHTAADNGKDL